MQVLEYRQGHLFEKHLEFTIEYSLKYANIDPAIEEFGNMIAAEMKQKYREFKKTATTLEEIFQSQ